MNSKYLAEIKAREQAATVTADDILNNGGGYSLFSLVKGKFYKAGEVYLKSDAEFITHAHADIKALISEIEQLKSAKDEINRYNIDCTKQCDKLLVQNITLKKALELACTALIYPKDEMPQVLYDRFIQLAKDQEQEEKK